MSEQSRFMLTFDGEALYDGSIEVSDLAPALLGLADAVDEVNRQVTRGEARVTLRVHSGFERGSFGVDLEIAQQLYRQFVEMFTSPTASAWGTFFSLLGLSGIGVIQLIKKCNGRRTRSVIEIERTERVRITFEGDDEPIEVPAAVWKLFNSSRLRAGLAKLVKPLLKQGLSKLELRHGNNDPVEITENEADAFTPGKENENELVTESERVLRIISPSFKPGNKWRVSEGAATLYVSIADDEFTANVAGGEERFGANDYLRVILRTRQWYESSELKASYEIVRILEHSVGQLPEQLNLGDSSTA